MISSITIAKAREKCKIFIAKSLSACRRIPRDILIIAILILASSASFGLGYLAGLDTGREGQGSDMRLETVPLETAAVSSTTGQIVASKNGTKYYLPSCAGSERISDANKIWFASASAAAAAGYAPAANCKGL